VINNIFTGKRVRLRAVEAADWEIHYEWNQYTEDARASFHIPFPESTTQVREWAENEAKKRDQNDRFHFQIVTLEKGELVGGLNTHSTDLRSGVFSYGLAIRPQYQRQGYASEAVRIVLRFFFDERRYQKVNAGVYSFNTPSIRLHEKLGFTLEGRIRRNIYTGGEYHDELLYGMTDEEFAATRR
jgi:RimJ/RimL family protein N-acetyltransferase